MSAEPPAQAPAAAPLRNADDLQKAIDADPKNATNYVELGRLYEHGGFLTLARDQYQKAFDLSPENPDAYRYLALINLQTQRTDQAATVINSGLKKFPDNYDVLLTAGFIFQNQRDYDRAFKAFEKAVQVNPKKADAHACLADMYGRKHNYDKALEEANKALEINPSLDLANYEKGAALISLKKYQDALGPLSSNFKKDPLESKSAQLYMELLLQLKRPAEAFEVMLCRIPAVEGKQLESYKEGVRTFIGTFTPEVYQPAISRADADLQKTPDAQAKVHFALGDIFDSLNKTDSAIEQYRRGLAIKPDFARGYLRLGFDLHSKKNDICGAMPYYKRAYELDKRDPQINIAYTETSRKIEKDPWLKFCCWFHGLFNPAPGANKP